MRAAARQEKEDEEEGALQKFLAQARRDRVQAGSALGLRRREAERDREAVAWARRREAERDARLRTEGSRLQSEMREAAARQWEAEAPVRRARRAAVEAEADVSREEAEGVARDAAHGLIGAALETVWRLEAAAIAGEEERDRLRRAGASEEAAEAAGVEGLGISAREWDGIRRAFVVGMFSRVERKRTEAKRRKERLEGQGHGTWGFERNQCHRLGLPLGGAGESVAELWRAGRPSSLVGGTASQGGGGAPSLGIVPWWTAVDSERAGGGVAGGTSAVDWAAWMDSPAECASLMQSPSARAGAAPQVRNPHVGLLLLEAAGSGGSSQDLHALLNERWSAPEVVATR